MRILFRDGGRSGRHHVSTVRRRGRGTQAVVLVSVLVSNGLAAGAGEPVPPVDDSGITVGATCPAMQLDCADARIATRWELGSLARDLPSGGSAWGLLETVEPAAILDRIDGAGLHPAEAGRFSMRGTSWTQNTILIDGVEVTDPVTGGVPLVLPDTNSLQSIEVTSALSSAEHSSPGVTLALTSRPPADSWQGTAQGYGLTSGLQSGPTLGDPPAIARFGSLADLSVLVRGPLAGERLGLAVSGRLARVRRFEGAEEEALPSRLVSGQFQLAYRAAERDTVRLGGVAQALERPLAARVRFPGDPVSEHTDALGATSAWAHEGDRATASAFAGFWTGAFVPQTDARAADGTVERLRDGPVPDLAFPSRSRRSSWSLGGRVAMRSSTLGGLRHSPRFGVSVRRGSTTESRGVDGPIPETVDGLAARVWDYSWPGPDSRRHLLETAAWGSERLAWADRLFVEAGLRLERTTGAAEGAAQKVGWTSLLPRLSARWQLAKAGRLTLLGGWAQYRHRLLLDALAFGDPNAASAAVYRWTDANGDGRYDPSERGLLVARAGPGTGNESLAGIDAGLRPPRTRELVAGLEASLGKSWLLGLTAFDRRETDLVASVDVGAPASAYSVRYLPDPGGDIDGSTDDQLLPVFDRKPESFGLDRYVLGNPPGLTGLHQAVEFRVEKRLGERFVLFAGATTSRTEVRGANRGFRVNENDQGVIGEILDDPNAATYALGRSFFDRAFTIKVAAAWRAPRGFRLGLAARYQDGQPFGRLVVVPDLAQGPEAIPATPRGQSFGRAATTDPEGRPLTADGHRFTYTVTVDLRVERGFRLGSGRLALVAEAFNLLGLRNEVEENVVWGPAFRDPTAVQPPRVARLGARFEF